MQARLRAQSPRRRVWLTTTAARLVLIAILVTAPAAFDAWAAQRFPDRAPFTEAIETFRAGRYQAAAEALTAAAEQEPAYAAPAHLWAAKALIAADNFADAETRLRTLRQRYPETEAAAEALYQLGRVAYLNDQYDDALRRLAEFVEQHPDSPFVGNAYYWAGESLAALGHFDEAETMFLTVAEQFPHSYRAASAEAQLDLLELRRRDAYFRRLLRWSHEEQLDLMDELDRRERALDEAVAEYRRKLFEQAPTEYRAQLLELEQERRTLEQQLRGREEQIKELEQEVFELRDAQAAPETTVRAYRRRFEALEIKSEALELQRRILEELLDDNPNLSDEDQDPEADA